MEKSLLYVLVPERIVDKKVTKQLGKTISE